MEEKMIVRSPEEQQIILRTNRILRMRLEQRVPGREEQLKLFDLILLRMSEKDAFDSPLPLALRLNAILWTTA